ncbi:MAG: type II secretion system secretin GspD [Epsilonproteobacteria bacterium]|nr:type II secretion system secretin GspD [Campylobacterota bacterium]
MRFIKGFLLLTLLLASAWGSQKLMINFSDTPIEDVVRFVAKETGHNILMTEKITGKVNFISEKPIEKRKLLSLLRKILQTKGYTVVRDESGGYLMVTRSANARKMATTRPTDAGMVTRIFHPGYIKPSDAVQKLRYLLSQFASVTFDNGKMAIIVTDYPERVEQFALMLSKIDRPVKKSVWFMALRHADAKAAVTDLMPVFKAMESSLRFPVTLKADTKSNGLIVITDTADTGKIRKIIEEYDTRSVPKKITSDVLFLNNAEAKATVGILKGLLKSFDAQTRSQVSFEAKEDINAIAITGTPEAVKLIEKVIKKLDIEQQQVYIKAHIYEISQRKVENLGIRWGALAGGITGNALVTGQLNTGTDVFQFPSLLQGLINMDNIDANVAVGAIIDLLKQNGAVNVVSEPNILCINNKKSSVYIGKTISILTSTVQGNQTTDLARNTYSREDIGLTLEVKPQIANDNKVLLEVKTKLEDIDQANTTEADRPTTFKREVQTVAIARDGENVIIGGLLKDYYSKGENRVPILGDIPVIGTIFRSKNNVKDQVNVIIILTPYIVKNSQSLAQIQAKIAETEKLKAELAVALEKRLVGNEKGEKHGKKEP